MPNTSNFGITYPANTDYVTNGASAMGTIASQVDTLLAGGQFMGGFRNKVINGDFGVWQRGAGPFAAGGSVSADQWRQVLSGSSVSTSRVAYSPASPLPGTARFVLQAAVTSVAGPGNFVQLVNRIENVGTLAGKTVTVSFWARSTSGTPKIGVSLDQSFGTGGSPSSAVLGSGTSFTLSTTWTRYSMQRTLPSIDGKTLGTNNDDYLQVGIWLDAGSTLDTRSGTAGQSTKTVQLWGVQVEAGSYATDFEFRPPQVELALCQRYFERLNVAGMGRLIGWSFFNGAVYVAAIPIRATQRMRATVGISASTLGNVVNTTTNSTYAVGSWSYTSVGDLGGLGITNVAVASANGNLMQCTDSVFDISAEYP